MRDAGNKFGHRGCFKGLVFFRSKERVRGCHADGREGNLEGRVSKARAARGNSTRRMRKEINFEHGMVG